MRPLLGALRCSPLSPASLGILLPYLAFALTALATGLHHRRLKARLGEEPGMWLYFAMFFLLLVALPVAFICIAEQEPGRVLAAIGLSGGNWRTGLPLLALALPVAALISVFASKSPALKAHYPYSQVACSSDRKFFTYELGYLLLYYTAWEFLYRGLLFLPLVGGVGLLAAASLSTALSVLHHIGQPDSETTGALLGGYLLCAVAFLTNSVLYSIAIHATLGVSNDLFIYLRYHRGKHSAV